MEGPGARVAFKKYGEVVNMFTDTPLLHEVFHAYIPTSQSLLILNLICVKVTCMVYV